jgi:peptidoglycan/LPS O-acetylase OafA/YrhL
MPAQLVPLNHEDRNLGLDVLRAFAAFWVVVIHGDDLLRPTFPSLPYPVLFDPVDLFFTLSGFLIGRIIVRELVDARPRDVVAALRRFWVRRWLRTVPAYFATTGLTGLFHLTFPDVQTGFNWRYLVFMQNLWTPHPWFMGNAWSLTIEEFFYVVFPLVVTILCGWLNRRRLAYVLSAVVLIELGLVVRWYFATVHDSMVPTVIDALCRKFLPTRLDAIAYGALGALVAVARPDWWKALALPGALAAAGVYAAMGRIPAVPTVYWVVSPAAMPVATLFALPALMRLRWLPRWCAAAVRYWSRISYSIYLVHYPLAYCYIYYVVRPQGRAMVLAWYVAYWAVSLVLASLLHHLVERPGLLLRETLDADVAVRRRPA